MSRNLEDATGLLLGLLGCILAVACSSGQASRRDASAPLETVRAAAVDEGPALLQLLEDRRLYEPVTVRQLVLGPAELRGRVAMALGRIGEPAGFAILDELLVDPEPVVRQAAAFGYGVALDRERRMFSLRGSPASLFASVADTDRETGSLAAEALAKAGFDLSEVAESVVSLTADDGWQRLIPALLHFPPASRQPLATLIWRQESTGILAQESRRIVARALTLDPSVESLADLRRLLDDSDPWIRGWAAVALGEVGDRGDMARLETVVDRHKDTPTKNGAVRGAGGLVERGVVAPSEGWRSRLLALLADPDAGTRLLAIDTSKLWLRDDELESVLESIVADRSGGKEVERAQALAALTHAAVPSAARWASQMATESSPEIRAAAAATAAALGDSELLKRLALDREALVRWAVVEAQAQQSGASREQLLRDALSDPAATVRSAALRFLAASPVLDLASLLAAIEGVGARRSELRLALVGALEGAASKPLERGAVLAALEGLMGDSSYAVRRSAAVTLHRLGQGWSTVERPRGRGGLDLYRQLLEQSRLGSDLVLETTSGTVTLSLFWRAAPRTAVNFHRLASQGFYDGLRFYRVAPGERLWTGDPSLLGIGSAGYLLQDEPNRVRFDRPGILGLEVTDADATSSRFFVTLAPAPELDGRAIAFGEVTSGLEVLAAAQAGGELVSLRPRS